MDKYNIIINARINERIIENINFTPNNIISNTLLKSKNFINQLQVPKKYKVDLSKIKENILITFFTKNGFLLYYHYLLKNKIKTKIDIKKNIKKNIFSILKKIFVKGLEIQQYNVKYKILNDIEEEDIDIQNEKINLTLYLTDNKSHSVEDKLSCKIKKLKLGKALKNSFPGVFDSFFSKELIESTSKRKKSYGQPKRFIKKNYNYENIVAEPLAESLPDWLLYNYFKQYAKYKYIHFDLLIINDIYIFRIYYNEKILELELEEEEEEIEEDLYSIQKHFYDNITLRFKNIILYADYTEHPKYNPSLYLSELEKYKKLLSQYQNGTLRPIKKINKSIKDEYLKISTLKDYKNFLSRLINFHMTKPKKIINTILGDTYYMYPNLYISLKKFLFKDNNKFSDEDKIAFNLARPLPENNFIWDAMTTINMRGGGRKKIINKKTRKFKKTIKFKKTRKFKKT